jgi:hypothetical protein
MGYDVWNSVVTGYTPSKIPPKSAAKKELRRNNKLAMDSILEGLPESMKRKSGKCTSAKELWDKLKELYIGEKVIKTNEELDERDKSNSSNENENNVEDVLLMNESFENKKESFSIKKEVDYEEDEDNKKEESDAEEYFEDEDEETVEVDLEGELICALE